MTCSQWVSIASLRTSRRYLVTKTRCTCRLWTTLLPRRTFGSGVHRGDMDKMVQCGHARETRQAGHGRTAELGGQGALHRLRPDPLDDRDALLPGRSRPRRVAALAEVDG